MICNFCFENENIKKHIEQNGEQADTNYQCEECQEINDADLVDEMFLMNKADLAEKLQIIIANLFEHENVHGLYGSATMLAEGDEDPNDYAGCLSLNEVCWELFEDGDKLSSLIVENHNWRESADGGYNDFSDEYGSVWKDKCWFEQDSLSWNRFSKKIKHSLRFFDTEDFNRLYELKKLEKLFEALGTFTITNTVAFRARGIKNEKLQDIQDNPGKELGQAPVTNAGHNRFSPSGISYIYLAFDNQTAVNEVYVDEKDLYAVGRFELKNTLKLLNLKKNNFDFLLKQYTNPFDNSYESYFACSIGALKLFITEIQKTISDDEKRLEYLPTQVLAEYIRLENYDGFIFDSTKNEDGVNIVLFENHIDYIGFEIQSMVEANE